MSNSIDIVTLNKPSITDFAKERNTLLANSKSDWIFFLDTDEKMSAGLKREIDTLSLTGFSGFRVKRKNYFCGQYSGTDTIIRLGKKNSGTWKRSVHETWEIKGRIGTLKNPIIHNTAGTVSEMISRINYYSDLHAKANEREGKRFSLLKLIFFPKAKFIQSLLMGRGVVFSILQSFHSFLSWTKQWELQKD